MNWLWSDVWGFLVCLAMLPVILYTRTAQGASLAPFMHGGAARAQRALWTELSIYAGPYVPLVIGLKVVQHTMWGGEVLLGVMFLMIFCAPLLVLWLRYVGPVQVLMDDLADARSMLVRRAD